jgi:DNA-binding response OmpR family regulator
MAGCGDACVQRRHDPLAHERHGRKMALMGRTVHAGSLAVDIRAGAARVDGRPVELPPLERAILLALAERAGEVVTYPELLRVVWGQRWDDWQGDRVRERVYWLRRRLGTAGTAITAIRGVGLRLEADA